MICKRKLAVIALGRWVHRSNAAAFFCTFCLLVAVCVRVCVCVCVCAFSPPCAPPPPPPLSRPRRCRCSDWSRTAHTKPACLSAHPKSSGWIRWCCTVPWRPRLAPLTQRHRVQRHLQPLHQRAQHAKGSATANPPRLNWSDCCGMALLGCWGVTKTSPARRASTKS